MPNPAGMAQIRKIAAERAENERAWEAGEFPAAAYRAVDLLEERIAAPDRYPDGWRDHIELTVRDAVKAGDSRDAAAIAAAVEPDLRDTVEKVNRPSLFERVQQARDAIGAIGAAPPGSYGAHIREHRLPAIVSPETSDLDAAIKERNRERREREQAQEQREGEMVNALTALVNLNESMMRQSADDGRRQFRLNVASVTIGALGIISAVAIALAT